MKKKLFVLAGLVVAVTAIIVVLRAAKQGSSNTCQTFLAAIEQGDATASYKMYTDRGKSFVTPEKWAKQVAILDIAYGDQTPKTLGDSGPITDSATGEVTGERQTYGIQYGDAKYKATCFITNEEPEKVDSFSSQIGY